MGVTWYSQPSFDSAILDSIAIRHPPDPDSPLWRYYSWDITGAVECWLQGAFPNYGVILRGPETPPGLRGFATSESSLPPQLVVTYDDSPALPPSVGSITPNSGPNDGTVSVTIDGANFRAGAQVKLTKSGQTAIQATGEVVVSPTRITCDLPLNGAATGQWNVVVTNSDTTSGSLDNGFTVTEPSLPPPEITSITPESGIKSGQLCNIVITGNNFQPGMSARVDLNSGAVALFVFSEVKTNDTLTGCLDLGSLQAGVYDLTVTNPDGQSDTLERCFTNWGVGEYSFTPPRGAVGTTVRLYLTAPDKWTRATFELTRLAATLSPSNVQPVDLVTVRGDLDLTGAAIGFWEVEVYTERGQQATLLNQFEVTQPGEDVTVSKITPNSGSNDHSVNVTVDGTGFQAGAQVKLTRNGSTIEATGEAVPSSTRITCSLPLNGATPGQWNVVVTNTDSSSGSLDNGFTVLGQTYTYLPLVLANYGSGYPTLVCGGQVDGKPKPDDWYRFTLGSSKTVTLRVTNYATKGQMQLRRNSTGGELIAMDGSEGSTKQVGPLSLGAGTYFVRLYPGDSYDANQAYHLTMTCN